MVHSVTTSGSAAGTPLMVATSTRTWFLEMRKNPR